MYRSLTLVFAAVLAVAAPVVHAQDRVAEQTRVAVKADDLATPAKIKMLYHRIEAAAKRVCDSDEVSPLTQQADKACETQAISETIRSVDAPQLSLLDPARDHRLPTETDHYASR